MSVPTPYVASLLRRTLESEVPAGWVVGDEAGSIDIVTKKNYVADLVRTLHILTEGDVSLGRGGGEQFIALIKACRYLENLVIRPMFLKSATYVLLLGD